MKTLHLALILLSLSGPVFHILALTVRDSGNYTCTLKANETSGSKTISQVVDPWLIWMIVLVTAGVMFMVFAIPAVIYNRRRKFKAAEENRGESGEKTQTKVSQDPDEETLDMEEVTYASVQKKIKTKGFLNQHPQSDEEVLDEGVTYASVCVKPNKPTKQRVHTEQQEEDDSVIYSTVKTA